MLSVSAALALTQRSVAKAPPQEMVSCQVSKKLQVAEKEEAGAGGRAESVTRAQQLSADEEQKERSVEGAPTWGAQGPSQ